MIRSFHVQEEEKKQSELYTYNSENPQEQSITFKREEERRNHF